jgi:surface antigen
MGNVINLSRYQNAAAASREYAERFPEEDLG